MNKNLLAILTLALFSSTLLAQEKAEVNVRITKDGEVLKDTLYTFDDVEKAKHVVHMMEMMSSENMHFEASDEKHVKMMASTGDSKGKKMIFISEDGDVNEVEDMDMDMKWTTEEGDSVKVIKIRSGNTGNTKTWTTEEIDDADKIIVNKDDGTVEIVIKKVKEGDEGETVKKIRKEVIIESDDDSGEEIIEWTVEEGEDGQVIVVSEDGKKIELTKMSETKDGEKGTTTTWTTKEGDDVNVTVTKKESEEGEDVEMEVKVEKTKVKKEKKKKK